MTKTFTAAGAELMAQSSTLADYERARAARLAQAPAAKLPDGSKAWPHTDKPTPKPSRRQRTAGADAQRAEEPTE